jgi:hypothetical protein
MGYLGKISAIVTANTGDFKPKLDAAAADVSKFARSMEGVLKSSAAQTSRAFDGIWTSLQRTERAMQAASSMKLSFKGIDGAIRDVDALNSRLASLAKRQVEVSVKGTGFKSQGELQSAYRGIKSSDVDTIRRLGGLQQAREYRGALNDKELASLDKFKSFGSLERFDKVIATMNSRAIDEANDKMRRLTSAAKELAGPVSATARTLESLSLDVQAQFAPAMNKASQAVENFKAAAEKGSVSETYFEGVRTRVEQTTAAVMRLVEAGKLAASGPRGNELAFQDPRLRDALTESAKLRGQAQNAPASILADGSVGRTVQQLSQLDDLAIRTRAEIEANKVLKVDTSAAEKRLSNVLLTSERVREELAASVNTVNASRAFTLGPARQEGGGLGLFGSQAGTATDQALARARELSSQFANLPESAQGALRGLAGVASNVANAVNDGTASAQNLSQVLDLLEGRIRSGAEASRAFTLGPARQEGGGLGLFGSQAGTATDQALARARELSSQFANLPESAQGALRGLAGVASNVANAVKDGTASADHLNQVLDRLASRMRDQSIGQFSRRASNLGPGGPENPPDGTNYLAGNLERRARGRMGGDVFEAGSQFDIGRQVDGIVGRVAAARSQLESLPEPIRAALIPSLQRATESAATLARAGFGATAAQIRNATAEAARFEQRVARSQRATNFSAQFGGPGRRGVEMELQGAQLGGYSAQLQLLQRELAGVSTQARAAATGPFDVLRAAIERAAGNGTLGLRQTRQEIQQLLRDAARATAGATGGSERGLMGRLQRAGDVGRGGFDKFTLAMQQAAFAIDDFFSVSGDMSQRIRAVGNNITQLGFVLGNTAGLVTALGASLLAQGVVAYIKFANSGREAEDSAKALNATLERQKSIVESLAEAFRSIASDIGSRGFKGATKDAAELSQRMDEIRKKQRDRNEARDAALSPEVQTIRATIVARQKELEKTSDINRSAALRADIEDLRRQERQAVRGLRGRQTPSVDQAIAEVQASRRRVSEGVIADVTRRAVGADGQGDPLAGARERNNQDERNAQRARLDELLLRQAPNNVERAVEARRIVERRLQLTRDTARQERGLFGTSSEGAAAEAEIARLQDLLNQMNAAVQGALDSLEVELSKQALLAATKIGNSLEALEKAIGAEASLTLQYTSELTTFVDQLKEAQGRLADAVESGDTGAAQAAREEIEALRESTREQVSAANSVAAFAAALDRVSAQLISTVLGESRSASEEARRAMNSADAAFGRGPAAREDARFAGRRNARLEREMRESENEERKLRRRREADVRGFEDDARRGNLDPATQQLIRQRDEAQAEIDKAVENNRPVNPNAVRRRDEAQSGLDRGFENTDAGRRNRLEANLFDQENARRKQREEDITRGRELMRTPAERAGLELTDSLRGLQAAFDEDPNGDPVRLASRQRKLAEEAARQAAPAIFGLADQVQNAILQGPSRAALQANDVTTTQGASELNRLLRGDDSAKNQDLVELQKQSKALDELVLIAKQNGAPPGIFDF